MDLNLPDEVVDQLKRCDALLAKLEEKAKPFLNRTTKDIDSQMDAVERAQVHLALAHTINSLLGLYLKARGVSPEDHGMEKERDRLQAFARKVKKAVAEKELSESRRTLEVDVAVLNRVITHAVPDLSAQQKQALKEAPAKRQAAGMEEQQQQLQAQGEAGTGRKKQRRGQAGSRGRDEALAFLEETMAEIQKPTGSAAGAGQKT